MPIRIMLGTWIGVLSLSLVGQAQLVRFAVLGDTHVRQGHTDPMARVVRDTLSADPPIQFVVVVGDLADGVRDPAGQADQFQMWRTVAAPWYSAGLYGLKVYPLPGNHDQQRFTNHNQIWQDAFPELPVNGPDYDRKMTYSWDVGTCHLVMVNTSSPNFLHNHAVDVKWIENDLKNSNQPIKLVFGHELAYKVAADHVGGLDCRPPLRDEFWKVLSDNRVKAYFCGHDHVFDQWIKEDVYQIITGGGGDMGSFYHYLIVDADEKDVTISVYHEPDNQLFAQYKLSDTTTVTNEDRTKNDNPYWPYNSPACSGAPMFLIVMLYWGGSWIGKSSNERL